MSSTTNINTINLPNSNSKIMLSMHMDYIHHVAFDVYGRRMATCSGDRFVRIWDLNDTGNWNLVGEWQAHRSSVTYVCWAHPEFGTLLATAGSDHDAKIWEERTHSPTTATTSGTTTPGGATTPINADGMTAATTAATTTTTVTTTNNTTGFPNTINTTNTPNSNLASRWTTKTQLTEARKAVSCLEFAPRHWGLKLATGSADGCVRIYEAVDIMNLSQWPLAATLQCFGDNESKGPSLGVLCLSWCTGRFEPPTLVVGGSHLTIFRYIESTRSWQPLLQLPTSSSTNPSSHVLDVAWAPNVGRRFHYIASAEDQQLRVYKLSRTYHDEKKTNKDDNTNNNTKQKRTSTTTNSSKAAAAGINNNTLQVESVQSLVTNAWRCQWNVTGTVLASSGDGAVVQMWKSDNTGTFQNVAQISE